ncbi:MAG: hypothetical protein CMLOHMNK_00398 [Steroidobacteraceae bacterium]|nr:hypothetical protein [Steroidobacteraceae bacterium]
MPSTSSHANAYFHDILYAVFTVLLRAGVSAKRIANISGEALEAAHAREYSKAPEDPHLSEVVASALHAWHHNRDFTDKYGEPKALHFKSKAPSLASLIMREDRRARPLDVVNAMKRLRLIRRTRDRRYRPSGRVAAIHALDPVLAEHVCHSLGRMLTTVSANTGSSRTNARFIERSAQVQDLPREKLREFRDFANSQGEIFISSINDWLEARRSRNGKVAKSRTTRAGVHVFAFAEPVNASRKASAGATSSTHRATPAG